MRIRFAESTRRTFFVCSDASLTYFHLAFYNLSPKVKRLSRRYFLGLLTRCAFLCITIFAQQITLKTEHRAVMAAHSTIINGIEDVKSAWVCSTAWSMTICRQLLVRQYCSMQLIIRCHFYIQLA